MDVLNAVPQPASLSSSKIGVLTTAKVWRGPVPLPRPIPAMGIPQNTIPAQS